MRAGTGGFLLLEDGTVFDGERFYGRGPALGEAVFNTSHTGYQEILTDPSYRRQIMVFTTPHIGNVGVNPEDDESSDVQVAGALVRCLSPRPSSWRSRADLAEWLEERGKPLLSGVDTRAVTLHLRTKGAMRAGLFPSDLDRAAALEQVKAAPSMAMADVAREVTCESSYVFSPTEADRCPEGGGGPRVAVVDFGVKRNILRELYRRGCDVTVFPATVAPEEILAGEFDGALISNGPGDPAATVYGVALVRALVTPGNWERPLFGICLGHQLLALAAGGRTFKLPFGHRGANHPVRRESDAVVEITSQNHGFAVVAEGVGDDYRVTHVNLNDGTVEGLEHRERPIFSIQYHPEASPGPHDGLGYFDRFVMEMRRATT